MQITSANMLANVLRDQRKNKRLSQSDTAKTVGLKQATVSAFENAPEGTKLATLFKLLAALNLELSVNKRSAKGQESEPATEQWTEEW